MSKHSKPGNAGQSPQLNRDHTPQWPQNISGDIRITGQVETHSPPDLAEKKVAADKKKESRENWKFAVECITMALVAFYAGFTLWQVYLVRESNKISRESLQSVQRPFLRRDSYIMAPMIIRNLGSPDIHVYLASAKLLNSGQTPAVGATGYFMVDELPGTPDGDIFVGDKAHRFPTSFIGSGASVNSTAIQKPAEFFIEKLANEPAKNRATSWSDRHIFIWGWMVYRDVFEGSKPHLTEFCDQLSRTDVVPAASNNVEFTWGSCVKHNCIDEYCEDYKALTDQFPKPAR